jgi:hypothetical protein
LSRNANNCSLNKLHSVTTTRGGRSYSMIVTQMEMKMKKKMRLKKFRDTEMRYPLLLLKKRKLLRIQVSMKMTRPYLSQMSSRNSSIRKNLKRFKKALILQIMEQNLLGIRISQVR